MKHVKTMLLATILLFSGQASAEIAVIVHPSNGSALDAGTVKKIFLGRAKSFPGGGTAVPVNTADGSGSKEQFDEKVLGKSAAQLKAYYSKLVFTGKGSAPKDVGDDAGMKSLIAANPNMIGYIDAATVDDSVKVALTL